MPDQTNAAPAANAKPASQAKPQTNAAPAAKGVMVTYTPRREDPVTCTWGKLVFEANKPRLVNDPRLIEKAKNNPWFKVEGEEQAKRGFDPATDKPSNAVEYRAFAVTWIKMASKSSELTKRWSDEEALRAELEVAGDELDMIAKHYDARLEQLKAMEQGGEAR